MDTTTTKAGTKRNFEEILTSIEIVKQLEAEGREATDDEKRALRKFTGFGAVATRAFPDPLTGTYADAGWEKLGTRLRELLTDEEYESAKATTFSAFYTSPTVMDAMWQALTTMGISPGSRGLEPGCGIGNFIGAVPDAEIEVMGVEKDGISGRIARALYPASEIRIGALQDIELPEGCVDFAVGNVPFSEHKIRYSDNKRYSLHDYFFLRSLDAVRDGGVVAMVTSRFTMDKADSTVRRLMAEKANFVGAIRLPESAFKDQGTSVCTDIIFLRKKSPLELETPEWADARWVESSTVSFEGGEAHLNHYFRDNPHMVLGRMSVSSGRYNNATLRVKSDADLGAALQRALASIPPAIVTERTEPLAQSVTRDLDPSLPAHVVEGSFFVAADGTLQQVTEGKAAPVVQRGKALEAGGTMGGQRLAALIELKTLTREVLASQQEGRPEEARTAARQDLRKSYDAFVSRFGPINKTSISTTKSGSTVRRMPNVAQFRSDPDVYLVMALEQYDERTGTATPSAILLEDVVVSKPPVDRVQSAKDGLLASLNQRGRVDLAYIAAIYGRDESEVTAELRGLIFFDPELQDWVPADQYLSGNVRQKLAVAESWDDPRAKANIEALREVQPKDLVPEDISVALGASWIPVADVRQFIADTLAVDLRDVTVEYVARDARWVVKAPRRLKNAMKATKTYGTLDRNAYRLIESALNLGVPTVQRTDSDGNKHTDHEATVKAREKQAKLKEQFGTWVFADPARATRLVNLYNEKFNNLRLREFDGSHLTFPRMSSAFTLRPHQKHAVWRNMTSGNTLLAHVVGAGKTFEMVAAGMEMRRVGLCQKPLYVVPNHMLEQFSREFLALYPDASLLVADKHSLSAQRKMMKARIQTGDYDGIIMTHSSFEKIQMSPRFQAAFLKQEIQEYERALVDVEDRTLTTNMTKRLEKLKASREQNIKEMMRAASKDDDDLFFDRLGIDQIFIDEAHVYKNLATHSKMDRVAGVPSQGSQRAFDLLMKIRCLQERTPGRGVTFATGTPISNTLGEMHAMMRYLVPGLLRERGVEHFDAWAASFGEIVTALEVSPDGKGFRINSRFSRFKNVPELLSLFRLFADVQTRETLDLPSPALKGGKAEVIAAPMNMEQDYIQEQLVHRYEKIRGGAVNPKTDNVLNVITDGRKLAIDARLVNPVATDEPDSKVNQLVDQVYAIWQRTAAESSTQLIFSDLGVNPTEWGFSVYGDVIEKLIARGIPEEEIANIGDATTDAKKGALFAKVRSGQVRILIGSTGKMGTGTNVQNKLVALHHLDAPWRPSDIEQREGRILRQGNRNDEVEIYRYVTEGSFDSYMWQTLENKARFIAQAMATGVSARVLEDIGEQELSYAEVKAIATGNPHLLILAQMDSDLQQLSILRRAHRDEQQEMRRRLVQLPDAIARMEARTSELEQDVARVVDTKGDSFTCIIGSRSFAKTKGEEQSARKRAADALALEIATQAVKMKGEPSPWSVKLGALGGLDLVLHGQRVGVQETRWKVAVEGAGRYNVATLDRPADAGGLIVKLENAIRRLEGDLARHRAKEEAARQELASYQEQGEQEFAKEDEFQSLKELSGRLKGLVELDRRDIGKDPAEIGQRSQMATAEIETIVAAYEAMPSGISATDASARDTRDTATAGAEPQNAGSNSTPREGVEDAPAEDAVEVSGVEDPGTQDPGTQNAGTQDPSSADVAPVRHTEARPAAPGKRPPTIEALQEKAKKNGQRSTRKGRIQAAKDRLWAYLEEAGWKMSRPTLKTPYADHPDGGGHRLWFRKEAIHLNDHSLHVALLEDTPEQIVAAAERRIEMNGGEPITWPKTLQERRQRGRDLLWKHLKAQGWKMSRESIREPWADHPDGSGHRIWFREDELYLNSQNLHVELASETPEEILAWVERYIRTNYAKPETVVDDVGRSRRLDEETVSPSPDIAHGTVALVDLGGITTVAKKMGNDSWDVGGTREPESWVMEHLAGAAMCQAMNSVLRHVDATLVIAAQREHLSPPPAPPTVHEAPEKPSATVRKAKAAHLHLPNVPEIAAGEDLEMWQGDTYLGATPDEVEASKATVRQVTEVTPPVVDRAPEVAEGPGAPVAPESGTALASKGLEPEQVAAPVEQTPEDPAEPVEASAPSKAPTEATEAAIGALAFVRRGPFHGIARKVDTGVWEYDLGDYGVSAGDDAWVMDHLARQSKVLELSKALTPDQYERLIPSHREIAQKPFRQKQYDASVGGEFDSYPTGCLVLVEFHDGVYTAKRQADGWEISPVKTTVFPEGASIEMRQKLRHSASHEKIATNLVPEEHNGDYLGHLTADEIALLMPTQQAVELASSGEPDIHEAEVATTRADRAHAHLPEAPEIQASEALPMWDGDLYLGATPDEVEASLAAMRTPAEHKEQTHIAEPLAAGGAQQLAGEDEAAAKTPSLTPTNKAPTPTEETQAPQPAPPEPPKPAPTAEQARPEAPAESRGGAEGAVYPSGARALFQREDGTYLATKRGSQWHCLPVRTEAHGDGVSPAMRVKLLKDFEVVPEADVIGQLTDPGLLPDLEPLLSAYEVGGLIAVQQDTLERSRQHGRELEALEEAMAHAAGIPIAPQPFPEISPEEFDAMRADMHKWLDTLGVETLDQDSAARVAETEGVSVPVAFVEHEGQRLLAVHGESGSWALQTFSRAHAHPLAAGTQTEDWVLEHLIDDDGLRDLIEHIPEGHHLLPAQQAILNRLEAWLKSMEEDVDDVAFERELASRAEEEFEARQAALREQPLALVQGEDGVLLAEQSSDEGQWEVRPLEGSTWRSAGYRDDAWVNAHHVPEGDLPELLEHLSEAELERLIPEQRQAIERYYAALSEDEAYDLAEEHLREESEALKEADWVATWPTPAETRETVAEEPLGEGADHSSRVSAAQPVDPSEITQMGLSFAIPPEPDEIPAIEPFASADQMALFPPVSVVVRAHRPPAYERAFQPSRESMDAILAAEAEYRHEREALGLWGENDDPREVESWLSRIDPTHERDMRDRLENGFLLGEGQPDEPELVRRFAGLVGEKPRLKAIIHDAIEHYRDYGDLVTRIVEEAGCPEKRAELLKNRQVASTYNGTLARRSGWEGHR